MGAVGTDVPWDWGTLCRRPWRGKTRADFKAKQHWDEHVLPTLLQSTEILAQTSSF